MADTVKIKVVMELTSVLNSRTEDVVEVPREEWALLKDEERQQLLDDIVETHVANHLESWAEVVEEEKTHG